MEDHIKAIDVLARVLAETSHTITVDDNTGFATHTRAFIVDGANRTYIENKLLELVDKL